jgi:hypothetical protein
LVLGAELWPWSSAACHCGAKEQNEYLTPEPWRRRFGALKLQKSGGRFTTSSKVPVPSDHKSDHKSRVSGSPSGVCADLQQICDGRNGSLNDSRALPFTRPSPKLDPGQKMDRYMRTVFY